MFSLSKRVWDTNKVNKLTNRLFSRGNYRRSMHRQQPSSYKSWTSGCVLTQVTIGFKRELNR